MLHIIWYIIIGFIAGAIANFIMHTHMTFVMTTILGIVGSIVGGLIARLFSKPAQGASFHPAGLILSIIGALIVLYVSGKLLHLQRAVSLSPAQICVGELESIGPLATHLDELADIAVVLRIVGKVEVI